MRSGAVRRPAGEARRLILVVVPGDRRHRALEAAAIRIGGPEIVVLPWWEALLRPERLSEIGRAGDWLRVESPGADPDTWLGLARRGGGGEPVPAGEWRPGRAWAVGLSAVLAELRAASPTLEWTHDEIEDLCDKDVCQRRLSLAGVAVPEAFAPAAAQGTLRSEELRMLLDKQGVSSVFVKSRWGSSGAGVVAWRRSRGREAAWTTAALQRDAGRDRLVNHKGLRNYTDPRLISALLAPLLRDGVVVQRWVPKVSATVDGREGEPRSGPFDVRVLVVAGRVTIRVARVGRGPITNLHLDAERADADRLLAGLCRREQVFAAAVAAARVFGRHQAVGVDVMVGTDGEVRVIECNAWGDQLPGLEFEGLDSASLQLQALLQRPDGCTEGRWA